MNYFFKALQIMGIVTSWSSKALEDGKVTLDEAADLAKKIADVLGIPTDIKLSK